MRDWLKEFILMLYYPISGILSKLSKTHEDDTVTEHDPTKPTIVIVKRWFNHNPLHIKRKQYLESKGFNVYYVFFSLLHGSWEESAHQLNEIMVERNLQDVTLVGISSGGITALLYLQAEKGWERVKTFVSIATPFGGSLGALFFIWNQSCRDVLPWTPFIQNIQSYKVPINKRFFSIRAKSDELVSADSAIHPAAIEVVVPVSGHNNLHLYSDTVYDKIAEIAHNETSF